MFIDGRSIAAGTLIEADVCIIGGGAAGIAIARELMAANINVVLMESGDLEASEESQELYRAEAVVGRPIDVAYSRLRYFGGTTNHWAGWCVPLDASDFDVRPGMKLSGWPIGLADLSSHYYRASVLCQVTPKGAAPVDWGIDPASVPEPFKGPHFSSRVLQVSPPTRFAQVYGPELRQASRVRVFLNSSVVELSEGRHRSEVEEARVATLGGNRFRVRAKAFVVAAGGIENARLLLHMKRLAKTLPMLGRCFMVHLEYGSGVIQVSDRYANFDFCRPFGNAISYVTPSDELMRHRLAANHRIQWAYEFDGMKTSVDALKRLTGSGEGESSTWDDLGTVFSNLDEVSSYSLRRLFFGQGVPVNRLVLRSHSEQAPNVESQVRLGDQVDALGMRRVVVDWRVSAEDKRNAFGLHRLLGEEIGRMGFGRLKLGLTEDERTWPNDLRGNEHHMGTTRMHSDQRFGVVDAHCRVHGLGNLYVAGSSVFATGGAANPTMTIVALALRLADRLRTQFA